VFDVNDSTFLRVISPPLLVYRNYPSNPMPILVHVNGFSAGYHRDLARRVLAFNLNAAQTRPVARIGIED
jgi:hypothetical protein